MESVIGRDSFTLAEFLRSADFILCNRVEDIINGKILSDYEYDNDWSYCQIDIGEGFNPFQWYLTSLDEFDVSKLHEDYGLKFIYCDVLDTWIFINDLCFGMSFDDCVIEKIEKE